MKKKLIMVLFIVVVGLCGCGEKSPDYQVLVNKSNPIPEKYIDSINLKNAEDVYGDVAQVEERTLNAYNRLHDALLKEGIEIGIDSAYRSVEKQEEIMQDFIKQYGEEYAKATVATPGTSEHHTGLVIDIVPKVNGEWVIENEDMLKQKNIFATIHKKCSKYGFIVRYPDGKEAITGYGYEPWHLRYVGEELAGKLYNNGDWITMEEGTIDVK